MAPPLARTLSYASTHAHSREWTPLEPRELPEHRLLSLLSSSDDSSSSLALARRLLEDEGADPNATLADGTSALALAAHGGSLSLTRLLLSHGADPSWQDERGDDVAEEALRGGNPALASYLRNRKQWTATERAAAAAAERKQQQAAVGVRKQRYLDRQEEQRRQARGAELVQQVKRTAEAVAEREVRVERVAGKWERRAKHLEAVAARRRVELDKERERNEMRMAKTEAYHQGANEYERTVDVVAQAARFRAFEASRSTGSCKLDSIGIVPETLDEELDHARRASVARESAARESQRLSASRQHVRLSRSHSHERFGRHEERIAAARRSASESALRWEEEARAAQVERQERLERAMQEHSAALAAVGPAAWGPELMAKKHAEPLKEKATGHGGLRWSREQEGLMRRAAETGDAELLLHSLTSALSENHLRILDLFRLQDADGDGRISRAEFTEALARIGIKVPAANFEALWRLLDHNGDGHIQLCELQAQIARHKEILNQLKRRRDAERRRQQKPHRRVRDAAYEWVMSLEQRRAAARDDVPYRFASEGPASLSSQRRHGPHSPLGQGQPPPGALLPLSRGQTPRTPDNSWPAERLPAARRTPGPYKHTNFRSPGGGYGRQPQDETRTGAAEWRRTRCLRGQVVLAAEVERNVLEGAQAPLSKQLKYHCDEVLRGVDEQERTALHLSAAAGQLGILKQLLKAGADVAATDAHERTPLHLAVANNFFEVCEQLVAWGARASARDCEGHTPLQLAGKLNRGKGDAKLVALLEHANQRQALAS